jgi:Tol biopolymer transport system component
MSDFTPLREGIDRLAGRAPLPEFGDLQRRVSRRRRTRRVAIGAAVVAAVVVGSPLALTTLGNQRTVPADQPYPTPKPETAPNGWVAVDAYQGGGDIYLGRLGDGPRRLEVAGSDAANDACPAWSPDGTQLMFGRLTGPSDTTAGEAKLVIVQVGQNGIAGTPTEIGLDGFEVLPGFDAHPCGTWAPDGRWVAFAGTGAVWVVDTQTGEVRHLPALRPSDLEWRPGTDELTIAGDMGRNRRAPTLSTPVLVYSVSTGEVRQLGSFEASHITWSPDGTSLAYTGGEDDPGELWLVGADGDNARLLDSDMGSANHGIGPEWSPRGDRIVYQRIIAGRGEAHEVVLVSVADGTKTVIAPPNLNGRRWYPFTVSWAPDGTTLLYAAWFELRQVGDAGGGVIAVPSDLPRDATVLIDSMYPGTDSYSHRWTAVQMWGRQPG